MPRGPDQDGRAGYSILVAEAERSHGGVPAIERRAVRHKLKVTQAEYDEIVARADRLGLSVNDYLIAAVLGQIRL